MLLQLWALHSAQWMSPRSLYSSQAQLITRIKAGRFHRTHALHLRKLHLLIGRDSAGAWLWRAHGSGRRI